MAPERHLSFLARELVDMTAPAATDLLNQGEEAVRRIDHEAHQLWIQLVVLMTGNASPENAMRMTASLVPQIGPCMKEESAQACDALQWDMQRYSQLRVMAALLGLSVKLSPQDRLRFSVIGVKEMHGMAHAVLNYLAEKN
jgi:hypothetical protein